MMYSLMMLLRGIVNLGNIFSVKDSSSKQIPRRIPLQMRKEMDKIIVEMERQEIIEKFISPWIS